MEYFEITCSYTLDYVSWTCPKCGTHNENNGVDLWDTECKSCGYDHKQEYNDVTSETLVVDYEFDDEE